jgi:hypothetical protein
MLGCSRSRGAAEVSPDTVARLECGEALRSETLLKLKRTLEKAGVEFITENGGGPGVRLRKRGKH